MNTCSTSTNVSFTVLGAFWHEDSPALLKNALKSICSNSLLPQEIILVQDGPVTPELHKLVKDFNFVIPFKLIQLNDNMGLGHAMNTGLESVKTPYVIRFDADDISLSNRFEVLMAKLIEGYDLVGSQVSELNGPNSPKTIRRVPNTNEEIRRYVRYRNPFNHMTVGFLRNAIMNVGGYPNIKLREDYALWAKFLASDYKVCNIDDILVEASVGDMMISRRGGFNNVISELRLQSLMLKLRIQTPIAAVGFGSIRCIVFMLPAFLRKLIYQLYLRGLVNDHEHEANISRTQ